MPALPIGLRPGGLRVGILGYPLGHSLSPVFQQAAFDALGLEVRYQAWPTPPEKVAEVLSRLRTPGYLGLNVTIPYKETVLPLLDELAGEARAVGAVNTVVSKEGRLTGHNTDVAGFYRALRETGFAPLGKRAVLLGAGGAARAVAYALRQGGLAHLMVVNRTAERARKLEPLFPGVEVLDYASSRLVQVLGSADLVVNCTSLGMKGGEGQGRSPLEGLPIPNQALVYDVVYNPEETPLLKAAKRAGARTLGGLPMLVYQGAASFKLWTGKEPPLDVMFQAARRALETRGEPPRPEV